MPSEENGDSAASRISVQSMNTPSFIVPAA